MLLAKASGTSGKVAATIKKGSDTPLEPISLIASTLNRKEFPACEPSAYKSYSKDVSPYVVAAICTYTSFAAPASHQTI